MNRCSTLLVPIVGPSPYRNNFFFFFFFLFEGLKSLLNQVIEEDIKGRGHAGGHSHAAFEIQNYMLDRMKLLEVSVYLYYLSAIQH